MSKHESTITGRTQISRLLNHLQHLQCPFTVAIQDLPKQQRQILAINSDDDYLMLDVSVPKGRPLPSKGQTVVLQAQFHGEAAECSTRIMESADLAGKALLRIYMPESITYTQRRAFFRVVLDTDTPVAITLIDEENGSQFGTLEDISLGGLAAAVRTNADFAEIQSHLCLIQLPGGQVFHSEIEIVNKHRVDSESVRIGARFLNVSDTQMQKLERFIRQVERDQLKKRAG